MRRRRYLKLGAAAVATTAGCAGNPSEAATSVGTSAGSTTSRERPDTIFVSPSGSADGSGTKGEPLASIQGALERAHPGTTVHVLPGEYREFVKTIRGGTPEKPIEITGPPDAVYRGGQHPHPKKEAGARPMLLRHSHVHLTGLSFDGLYNPEKPDTLASYASQNVVVDSLTRVGAGGLPPKIRDVKVKPHTVGNTKGPCVHVFHSEDVEVGEFEVIGPAGVAHFVFANPGHDGEVVYIGTVGNGWRRRYGGHVGRPNNIHVHHIDNSAGYKHAEIADAKAGTSNVLIEYCTSVGNVSGQPAIHLGGVTGVARWNRVVSAERDGVVIGNHGTTYEQVSDAATKNAVYGNRIRKSGKNAIHITPDTTLKAQEYVCGNDIGTTGDGNPEKSCPAGVPTGDGVGHTGGQSPWD